MEFKEYTVEELVELKMLEKPMDGNHGGKHPTSKDYVKEGIPFIMVSDINNGKINYNTCKYISKSTRDSLDKGFSKPNDVLLSHKATIGLTAIVGEEYEEIVLTPQLTYYRVLKNINNRYLKYYFDSSFFQDILSSWATSGSTRAYLGITAQLKLPIILPDINTQNKIAKILSDIDKKIELNNQINDNLLEFIKELYIETFKDEKNKKKIKEVVEFSQGVQVPIENQSEKYDNGFTRFIRIVDLTQGGKDNIRYIANKDRGIVDYDDVFMIRYGSPGILGWNYKGIIANNLFKINPKSDETTKNYLYCYFNDAEIKNYIKQNATSSTMPAINFSLLYDRLIAIPNKEKLTEFDRIIENTRLKLLEIKKENEKLEQLRDTVLPKLMNGEIDLDKIEI